MEVLVALCIVLCLFVSLVITEKPRQEPQNTHIPRFSEPYFVIAPPSSVAPPAVEPKSKMGCSGTLIFLASVLALLFVILSS